MAKRVETGIILIAMYALILAHQLTPHCHQAATSTPPQHAHHHSHDHSHHLFLLSFLFDHHGQEEEDEAHLEQLQPEVEIQFNKKSLPSPILTTLSIQRPSCTGSCALPVLNQSISAPQEKINDPPPLYFFRLRAPPAAVKI